MIINLDEYKQYLKETKKAKGTITNYMTQLRLFEKYMVASGYDKLCGEASESYKEYLLRVKKDEVSSVNTKITVLNTYFNYLKSHKRVRRTRKFKLKKERIQDSNNREYLIEDEYNALYDVCRHEQTKLLMKIISQTGLRITEATTLTLNQIRPDLIKIYNKKKWRVIGMKTELKDEIREFFKGKGSDEKLFTFSQTTYRNRMNEAAELSGVNPDKVYPHAFRHYFAKEYLRTAKDNTALRKLQKILGHSDMATTALYLQFTNKELVESMM